MRKLILPSVLFFFAAAVFAADEQTIELKDGGKVIVQTDGTMIHTNAAGIRMAMKDGQIMEAKDGSTLLMKNSALWKRFSEQQKSSVPHR